MRSVWNRLAVAAVVAAVGSVALVQAAAPMTSAPPRTAKAEKRSTLMSANGTVEKFDESTKTLTVATKAGERQFTLGPNAKITEGAATATTADLSGKQVKVTYSHVDGKNVASKVTIAGVHKVKTSAKAASRK